MDAIKKELRLQGRAFPQFWGIILGAFILGRLISLGINWFVLAPDDREEIPLGMALMLVGLVIVLFCIGAGFVTGLNNAIVMSRTRRGFFIGHFAAGLLQMLASLLLVWILCQLELRLPGMDPELLPLIMTVFRPGIVAAIVLGGVVTANFAGAAVARYGKTAGWLLWAVWMFCCLVLPRMLAPSGRGDSLLSRAGSALSRLLGQVPLPTWGAVGAAAVALMFAAT